MKLKYSVLKDAEKKELTIREYAELDKETLTFVYESTYPGKQIESAISKGTDALISVLRTPNFYPAGFYAEKIAEAVQELYRLGTDETIDLFFDDIEFIPKDIKPSVPEDDLDDSDDDIDDLIEDDLEEKYEDKPTVASIKIDDNDFEDVSDEN
jgi:hypothetical protein